MTADQKAGALSCLDAFDRALNDVKRAAIIAGAGVHEAGEMAWLAVHLRRKITAAPVRATRPAQTAKPF